MIVWLTVHDVHRFIFLHATKLFATVPQFTVRACSHIIEQGSCIHLNKASSCFFLCYEVALHLNTFVYYYERASSSTTATAKGRCCHGGLLKAISPSPPPRFSAQLSLARAWYHESTIHCHAVLSLPSWNTVSVQCPTSECSCAHCIVTATKLPPLRRRASSVP